MLTGLHHADRNGASGKTRTCNLHLRKVVFLYLNYRSKLEQVNGYAPSSQRWQRRVLLLNHTCKNLASPARLPLATFALGPRRSGNCATGTKLVATAGFSPATSR